MLFLLIIALVSPGDNSEKKKENVSMILVTKTKNTAKLMDNLLVNG